MPEVLDTILCRSLGCRYPVLQTAMGWIATPELVAASCNAGAFGFLAGAVLSPAEIRAAIAQIRARTDRPFGVNFHMFQPGADEIVEILVAERVRAVSFGRGPQASLIKRFRDAGILCIPTVGALKHAKKMAEIGVDMVTVQGSEGGGHTGSVATSVLLPQVLDAVKIPVIAAGGFADGRGLAAALAYGAVGIAMGTRFLMTRESPVPDAVKQRYLEAGTDDIFVTTRLDGLPLRIIRNEFTARIERSGAVMRLLRMLAAGLRLKSEMALSWRQVLRLMREGESLAAAAAPMKIRDAVVHGRADDGVLASGQVAGRLSDLPSCAELLDDIMRQARARFAALSREGAPA